jgi:hypothetical protein
MKKNLLTTVFVCLGIILSGSLYGQTWDDLVEEIRGDTLVIKGTSNSGGVFNTIGTVIKGDTTATGERNNPNRVYETMPGQVYISDAPFRFDETVGDIVITAPHWEKTDDVVPPLWIKSVDAEGEFNKNYFHTPGSFYMENQYILMALLDGQRDREFGRALGDNARFEFHHNIFELTNWCLHYPRANHQVFKFTDNLFINVGYEATLEKGNVYDSWYVVDTLWMENNTFLNVGNVSLARPNLAPSFAYYNHNTMVNATMPPFLYFSQPEMIVTNNLIINQSLMPDYPGFYSFHEDADQLPKGIINADTVQANWISDHWPDGYPVATEADRKILVDKNATWWDPRFQDMFDNQLPAFPDTIDEVWASQMIRMNDRTQAMFDDDDAYPYFVEGTWYDGDPGFTNNADRVDAWVDFIVTNSTPGDPNGGNFMPWWRTNDQTDENLVQPDWPPLADLTYSDATMQTGGVNNYPLGDLNWYPDMKESWMATGEPMKLIEALKAGQLPEDWAGVGIELKETESGPGSLVSLFPNPANDLLYLKSDYELSNVTIYDMVGQMIKHVDVERHSNISLDISDLRNGVYVLKVKTVSGASSSSKFVKK